MRTIEGHPCLNYAQSDFDPPGGQSGTASVPDGPASVIPTAPDRGTDDVRWKTVGALYLFGGLLSLLSLVLSNDADAGRSAIGAVGAGAVLGGALIILAAARMPANALSPVIALGTLLISVSIVASRDATSVYALLYVWVGFEAFLFLSRRVAVGHVVMVGLGYAAALVAIGGASGDSGARWLLTMGTIAILGPIIHALRERSVRLMNQLGAIAHTDSLTNVLNRRGFEQRFELELQAAADHNRELALVIGDLDRFKSINDENGHAAGDRALQRFVEQATATLRGRGRIGRIGGEEFAFVLPGAGDSAAFELAEEIRTSIQDAASAWETPLTVSFGIAIFPRDGITLYELLAAADRALYVAKRLGRNRTASSCEAAL